MSPAVAIVGIACRYPDARSPDELWENVLAQRRAFRRLPPERLRLEDYLSADRRAPDSTYSTEAALIEGYEFDRVRFRAAGGTFRSADPAHWLALDVASQALNDAGFVEGEGLPRQTTGVFLGNTLTGDVTRANNLRLRWPYVRRVVEASLADEHWPPPRRRAFLEKLEGAYKEPFPPVGEESLAGGLSNTIAGRICNYFDLQGGGHTVDGACASSLLAAAHACSALVANDMDVALAGGVDLSLDPFELVGFAKAGALATDEMRVYDARSNGFWPGEGCGFVVLMRHEDAVTEGRRVYAVIRGWGVSSDGSGGITRPRMEGQLLALQRAYRRAGFGIETVAYFEGHGTGTSVGDVTEMRALSRARRESAGRVAPAAIGSIKANIGHTKAAAGIAGLIKAALALDAGVIPPATGCEEPHAELSGEAPALRVLRTSEPWPAGQPPRAGVSAMGFGGLNTHVVVEANGPRARNSLSNRDYSLDSSAQDAELFLLGAPGADELQSQVTHLLSFVAKLSRAELSDLAAELSRSLGAWRVRAAVVASTPGGLFDSLEKLGALAAGGAATRIDAESGIFFSAASAEPRIGFLFPGQGSPSHVDGGALRRRFAFVQELYARVRLAAGADETTTGVAQPAIVTASLAALRVLERLGVSAQVSVGHSLGELTALHWAGALDEEALLRLASARGRAMTELSGPAGAMASINAGGREVEALLNGDPVVIACLNSPQKTVISGGAEAVAAVMARARAKNLSAVKLPVSHAFHSPLVAPATRALTAHLAGEKLSPLRRAVVSTVDGKTLAPDADLPELLRRQITSPVRFLEAVSGAESGGVDLWLEAGPGEVLRGLIREINGTPVISLDAGGPSLKGVLCAAGAAFALGQPLKHEALFAGRFTRPFDLNWQPKFFVNPCELAPVSEPPGQPDAATAREATGLQAVAGAPHGARDTSTVDLLARLVAELAELPPTVVAPDGRFLSDLHLNSITVSQLLAEAAQRLGVPRLVSPTDFADATIAEAARALDEQLSASRMMPDGEAGQLPPGLDSWIRPFRVELVESPLRGRQAICAAGRWQVLAPPAHPLADSLRLGFAGCGAGEGVVVCLPPDPDETCVGLLLEGARAVLGGMSGARFVLAQHGQGAAAFARTLHLEAPLVNTCVVNVPQSHPQAAEWIIAEALAAEGYVEAHYAPDGRRREPVLRPLLVFDGPGELPLNSGDVLLVTGGGKGITALCALALARESGARLALFGLASPEEDAVLAANLNSLTAAGVEFTYISADVTDPAAVRAAIGEVERRLGAVTGILHGAARNVPRLLSGLDEEMFRRTLAVKVGGARHLLAAIDPAKLRLFVTFGSVIARTGLPGEADYGLANEWLTRLTEEWGAAHPACRCLAVEWTVWAGAGMGARLGRTDVLARQGITPIPPDEGTRVLGQLLGHSLPSVSVVVTGRFGDLPTLKIERPEVPFWRFLEQPRVHYPGVELVVDVDLSASTDPYLNDHRFQGQRLLPAVMGLEAMAQAAMALADSTEPPVFEDVNFHQPVVVPETGTLRIRLAALVRGPRLVEVALRSEETNFQANHFQATCRFKSEPAQSVAPRGPFAENGAWPVRVALDPARDLYGGILFHGGRFRRLRNYRLLKATECLAEITPDGEEPWFGRYLPGDLVLGDPGARDASIHAIQACIPHATLLPVGVKQLWRAPTAAPPRPLFAHARERSHDGDTFTYDLSVWGADGCVCERWEGLRLRRVGCAPTQGEWAESLLAPYIERRVGELVPGASVSIALLRDAGAERRARSDRAIRAVLGRDVAILRRPDGRPEVAGGPSVSTAHTGDLTLAAAGSGPLGCDVEQVTPRHAPAWRNMLGEDRSALAGFISRSMSEDMALSATRVWAAGECLKKAGAALDAPLLLASSTAEGWAVLSSGRLRVATCAARVKGFENRLLVAVLVESNEARL